MWQYSKVILSSSMYQWTKQSVIVSDCRLSAYLLYDTKHVGSYSWHISSMTYFWWWQYNNSLKIQFSWIGFEVKVYLCFWNGHNEDNWLLEMNINVLCYTCVETLMKYQIYMKWDTLMLQAGWYVTTTLYIYILM